ncbi:MAG: hypothetical protein AAGA29_11005 [Planctomycetota bacterium]
MPLFALALTFMLTGALQADQSDSPLVGSWMAVSYMGEEIPEGAFWVENHADGTGTLHEGDAEYPYTWEHDVSAGTCTVTADGEVVVYNVEIDGDECKFINPDNADDVMVLKRMAE